MNQSQVGVQGTTLPDECVQRTLLKTTCSRRPCSRSRWRARSWSGCAGPGRAACWSGAPVEEGNVLRSCPDMAVAPRALVLASKHNFSTAEHRGGQETTPENHQHAPGTTLGPSRTAERGRRRGVCWTTSSITAKQRRETAREGPFTGPDPTCTGNPPVQKGNKQEKTAEEDPDDGRGPLLRRRSNGLLSRARVEN
jgi:hypothetical protein